MKKGAFLNYLQQYGLFYLTSGLVVGVALSLGFAARTKATENEKLDILVSCLTFDEAGFKTYLKEQKPSYLKELNYRYVLEGDSSLSSIYGTYGSVEGDLFFLSAAQMDSLSVTLLLPLEEPACAAAFSGHALSYYEKDGTKYGLAISSSYIGGGDYYAFFAKSSLHLGSLKEESLDGCLSLVRGMLP